MKPRKIVFVANSAWNLAHFRVNLIKKLLAAGDQVHCLCPADSSIKRLLDLGCQVTVLPMQSSGTNPLQDLRLIWRFFRLYSFLRPNLVCHFTIKPNIYGSLAARLARVPCLNNITGLGTLFIRPGPVTKIALILYRLALAWAGMVFFQNRDDRDLFVDKNLVDPARTHVLPGSGVDTLFFHPGYDPPTSRGYHFLCVSRMIRDKGIMEFVAAVGILKKRHPEIRAALLGPLEVQNVGAIPRETVLSWQAMGIDYLGQADDVRPYIALAQCLVLPSYREGLPRTLLEGAAMGKPLIATNVPGCKDVVLDNENGFLCLPKNPESLAQAMERMFLLTDEVRNIMGSKGRSFVEQNFSEDTVIQTYLQAIDHLSRPRNTTS